jgi:hypothetical protein
MGQSWYKPYKHISEATSEIISYICNRKSGVIKSLKTRWEKFNNLCMGGIEPNTIYTVAGISGSGNSKHAGFKFLNIGES